MRARLLEDAGEFLRDAGPLLLPSEPRENLIFGIAGEIVTQPDRYDEQRFWVVEDTGAPVAAALRTPPFNLVLAQPRGAAALAALVEAIDDELPGVVGGRPEVDEFARLWAERHAIEPQVLREQGIYSLEHVQPVPEAAGRSRDATEDDLPLLLNWMDAFGREALGEEDPGRVESRRFVEHRLRAEEGGFVLWEDSGEPVSLSGWGGPTPNGIRIGPVYTPPALRGRGYATSLVAQLSQRLLDGGLRFCFLFTDLANPTSNRIYERIGYVRVGESAMLAFEPRS
jgi:predicted GNAT family acetyltransferase